MNCIECQENLAAHLEGLLEPEQAQALQTHLETCPACQAEQQAFAGLQRRLVARGRAAADVALVEPVMNQIRKTQMEREERSFMKQVTSVLTQWKFGLSAAAGATAVVALILFLSSPGGQASAAAQVMARGAKAVAQLTAIHMRCQMRTAPADNFGMIAPKMEFVPVELWKEFNGERKWRIDKPGRVAVMDGTSTVLFIRPSKTAMRGPATRAAFDTDWLHAMADISKTLTGDLRAAQAKGWNLNLTETTGANGAAQLVVTVEAKSGLPNGDYMKNKFFPASDTRRVYVFDAKSERLVTAQVYLREPAGEVLIFEVTQIDYDQPIDPAVFSLELPADVNWYQEPQKLPDNEKYAAMTSEQAARAFFEACGREDWTEAGKFWTMPIDDRLKQALGGLEVISLGESFTSRGYPGKFVPYEIKFKNGQVKKWNLALKKDRRTERWFVDGGL